MNQEYPKQVDLTRLLTAPEVARVLNISRAMAFKILRTGLLPSIHIGRSVRVRLQDLEQFIEQNVSNGGSSL